MAGKGTLRGLRRSMSRTRKSRAQVLMLGLGGAGKTTMLTQWHHGRSLPSPTIGFNAEGLELEGLSIACWDLGRRERIGPVWRHHVSDTSVIIMVVDASDEERLDLARTELVGALSDQALTGCSVVVAANKQDVQGALGGEDVAAALGMSGLRGHTWRVIETSAATGEGLDELLDAVSMLEGSFASSEDSTSPPRHETEESFLSRAGPQTPRKSAAGLSRTSSRWSFRMARDLQHMLSQAL